MKTISSQNLAGVSIGASVLTIILKLGAFALTNSVSLLSDALESLVNLLAATITFFMVRLAHKPADESHPYGHSKAEYISSTAEGMFIIIAAGAIIFTAVQRLLNPSPLEAPGLGLLFSIAASLINLIVGLTLIKNGKKRNSLALEADGHHLMTDVYTTVGVLIGLAIVYMTKLYILDPIIAIIVGLNIIFAGFSIIQKSFSGFMDSAIDRGYIKYINTVFEEYTIKKIVFHGLRTRRSGSRNFITFHVLVPGIWTVQNAHSLVEEIEKKLRDTIPNSTIDTHIEPLEDPVSWADTELDRK